MLAGQRIDSLGDLAVHVPAVLIGAALIAWGWSPLTQWLTRRRLGFELSPKAAWWIGFIAFGAWSLVTSGVEALVPESWLPLSAGLLTAGIAASLFARQSLSREAGRGVSLSAATFVAVGTFATPLGLILLVAAIVKVVAY